MGKKQENEIVFDGNIPLIKWKSELELAMDELKTLNKEIGFFRGFMYGIMFTTIIDILIILICLLVF